MSEKSPSKQPRELPEWMLDEEKKAGDSKPARAPPDNKQRRVQYVMSPKELKEVASDFLAKKKDGKT